MAGRSAVLSNNTVFPDGDVPDIVNDIDPNDEVASASSIDLTGTGFIVDVTGITTVTEIIIPERETRLLRFPDGLTIQHESSHLQCPGQLNVHPVAGAYLLAFGIGDGHVRILDLVRDAIRPSKEFENLYVGTIYGLGPSISLYLDFSSGGPTFSWVKADNSGQVVWDIGTIDTLQVWEAINASGKVALVDSVISSGVIPKFDSEGVLTTGYTASNDGTLAGDSASALTTEHAVKTYVDQIIAAQDAMVFKGVTNCSGNPNYPAADRGHTYRVSVAGKIGGASGPNVEVGDTFICLTDGTVSGTHGAVGASWGIIQTNLDGAVIGPASVTDGHIAQFDGTTGKLIKGGVALDTDGTLAANSDTRIATQKAVKTFHTDANISTTDVTTNDVTSSKHGFAPKSPADATKFLNGAATPAFAAVKDTDLSLSDTSTNNASSTKHGFLPKTPADSAQVLSGEAAAAFYHLCVLGVPYTFKVKNVTVQTGGAAADIATITLPAGLTRWMLSSSANLGTVIAETAAGTLAAGSIELRDTINGGGTAMTASVTLPAGTSGSNSRVNIAGIVANTSQSWFTTSVIAIRQTANSSNAGTVSFYVTVIPII